MTSPSTTPDAGFQFVDLPTHPKAMDLFAYWTSKCAGRPMPDRADIDLTELRAIAPNLVISEPVDGGADFRLRLYGTALAEVTGEERTGKLVSEIGEGGFLSSGNIKARWRSILSRAYETAQPAFARARSSVERREHIIYHGMALPLTLGGTGVGQILGGLFTEYTADASA